MTQTQRKLKKESFFTIVEKLYSIEGLGQDAIDEMLFAYLNHAGLIEEWHEAGINDGILDKFFESLNSMSVSYYHAAKMWEEYMETEPETLEQIRHNNMIEERDLERELLDAQTGFCQ